MALKTIRGHQANKQRREENQRQRAVAHSSIERQGRGKETGMVSELRRTSGWTIVLKAE